MHPASHNDPFVIMTLVPPGSWGMITRKGAG
jgi:hypothetical protein